MKYGYISYTLFLLSFIEQYANVFIKHFSKMTVLYGDLIQPLTMTHLSSYNLSFSSVQHVFWHLMFILSY